MPTSVTCPGCGTRLKLPDGFDKPAARCPRCNTSVPAPAAALSLDNEPEPSAFDFSGPKRPPGRGPRPAEDDTPKWLLGVAVAPLALAPIGGLIGGLIGGATAGVNGIIARVRGVPVGLKVGAMGVTTAVAVALYLVLAFALVDATKERDGDVAKKPADNPPAKKIDPPAGAPGDDPPEGKPPAKKPPAKKPPTPVPEPDDPPPRKPPVVPPDPDDPPPKKPAVGQPGPDDPPPGRNPWAALVFDYPASPAVSPAAPPAKGPPLAANHFLFNQGWVRLPEGPTAVTAASVEGNTLAVGFADGSIAVWDLTKPLTEPPSPGPKLSGPVDRLWIVGKGRYLVADSDGRIRVLTAKKPFQGVTLPPGAAGIRVCNFGTAAVILNGPDGYTARWLVNAIFDDKVAMPPQGYSTPFDGFAQQLKLDPPPEEPQFLTWLHVFPAAVLPDGRMVVWRHGKTKPNVLDDQPTPIRSWATGPGQVVLATLDQKGMLRMRFDAEFTPKKPIKTGVQGVTRIMTNDSGDWTLGADADGGVYMWRWYNQEDAGKLEYRGQWGTRREPVLPLATVWPCTFVVGRGRAVELWAGTEYQRWPKR